MMMDNDDYEFSNVGQFPCRDVALELTNRKKTLIVENDEVTVYYAYQEDDLSISHLEVSVNGAVRATWHLALSEASEIVLSDIGSPLPGDAVTVPQHTPTVGLAVASIPVPALSHTVLVRVACDAEGAREYVEVLVDGAPQPSTERLQDALHAECRVFLAVLCLSWLALGVALVARLWLDAPRYLTPLESYYVPLNLEAVALLMVLCAAMWHSVECIEVANCLAWVQFAFYCLKNDGTFTTAMLCLRFACYCCFGYRIRRLLFKIDVASDPESTFNRACMYLVLQDLGVTFLVSQIDVSQQSFFLYSLFCICSHPLVHLILDYGIIWTRSKSICDVKLLFLVIVIAFFFRLNYPSAPMPATDFTILYKTHWVQNAVGLAWGFIQIALLSEFPRFFTES